jgi:hypothetical protein
MYGKIMECSDDRLSYPTGSHNTKVKDDQDESLYEFVMSIVPPNIRGPYSASVNSYHYLAYTKYLIIFFFFFCSSEFLHSDQ